MKRHLLSVLTLACVVAAFAGCASSNGRSSAGRAATAEPLGGQPAPGAKPSVPDLQEQVVYQRAFEVVIWSQPLVGLYGFRHGFDAVGVKENDVLAMSHPAGPQVEALTANNTTPYISAYTDLRKGPMVLEVPAAAEQGEHKGVLFGQVVDAWQETIAAVGPSGADKGKGGKYLLLPPGYDQAVPEGYFPVRSPNYGVSFAFRSIKLPGMTDADAHAYAQTLKLYPLTAAANPAPTRFVDPGTNRFPTLAYYDFRYFEDLAAAIRNEPVRPRDLAMMDMLKTIGIEPGKPFSPPIKYKAAMERAVVDAYFYMQQRFFQVQADNLYYPDRHWCWFFISDREDSLTFQLPEGLFYTARSDMYHPATYLPPRIPQLDHLAAWAKEGNLPATAYLGALADNQGRRLEAGKTYKLHVPAVMPVKQFWSLIIYDFATWAFIYNPTDRVGLSTYDVPNIRKNADGSVDIYFGPKPPEGLESNWIPTGGKQPIPVLRMYGGTEDFWSRRFKMPDVELVK